MQFIRDIAAQAPGCAARSTRAPAEIGGEQTDVAIVGAGPYGLSLAAHLRTRGVRLRIFGRVMDSWLRHMPKGMHLKSDGFASNIYDPDRSFTLRQYCRENGIDYHDTRIPVRLDTFASYGLAFRDRMVPELEDRIVTSIDGAADGFVVTLDDEETVAAKQVVLAVGITHFDHVPDPLAQLPPEYCTHSARHHDTDVFRGRSVTVIGGGASALDLAGLLRDGGADVQLVARRPMLRFDGPPSPTDSRSLWERLRRPRSGLGPGWRSRFYTDAPLAFHRLPERLRLKIVARALGPRGGWASKARLVGRVPLLLGQVPIDGRIERDRVRLRLQALDGAVSELTTDHVIAATGYRVDLGRLRFLSPEIRSRLATVQGSPILSSRFEASVRGLYFVGLTAAASFGPVSRFAFGAGFTARRLSRVLACRQ